MCYYSPYQSRIQLGDVYKSGKKKGWKLHQKHPSQVHNVKIFPDMKKIDPWKDDYSRDQLLDEWEMCMHCHIKTMLNKNEVSQLVLPSSITILVIASCSITTDALPTCIKCLVSLSALFLHEIRTITSLPPEEVLCALKNLRSLCIVNCFLLSSLESIKALTYLTELELTGCLKISQLFHRLRRCSDESYLLMDFIF